MLCAVPSAIPGQIVDGRVIDIRANPPRAILQNLVQQSEHFIRPVCKYFEACGGCKTQHLQYSVQAVNKENVVKKLMNSFECEVSPIQVPGIESGLFKYRNKMEFTCSTGRWLIKEDIGAVDSEMPANFTLGLFPKTNSRRRWDGRVLAIKSCWLQEDIGNRVLEALWTENALQKVEAYDHLKHTGLLKNVMIRIGTSKWGEKEVMIGFGTSRIDRLALEPIVTAFLENLNEDDRACVVSIINYMDEESKRRYQKQLKSEGKNDIVSETQINIQGQGYIHDTILDKEFQLSLRSFFQPNTAQASVLYSSIRDICANFYQNHNRRPVVWDLFCGVGSIGICVADECELVIGIDIVDAAITDAKQNAEYNSLSNKMQFICSDLTAKDQVDVLASLIRPDIVIVDPPRPGLSTKLCNFIQQDIAPAQICYVSCNPLTQARDLQYFDEKYTISLCQPVDMLPHTPHLENIILLTRR